MNWDRKAERGVRVDATVRRVRQIASMDCGVAAVAMIANVPYSTAHEAIGRRKGQRDGTYVEDCWDALRRLGVRVERSERPFRSWAEIPSDALVCIQWRGTKGYHWVVYQRLEGAYRILDPQAEGGTLSFVNERLMKGLTFSLVQAVRRSRGRQGVAPSPLAVAKRATATGPPVDPAAIGGASVVSARASAEIRNAIRGVTGLSIQAVSGRLRRHHGRTLVRNAFKDVWPIS